MKLQWLFLICLPVIVGAQMTPEDERMYFEKSQQLAQFLGEHPEKMDSILNEMDRLDKEMRMKKTTKKITPEKAAQPETTEAHLSNYLISSGNDMVFDDWGYGNAEILLVTQPYKPENRSEIKVGIINDDGRFSIKKSKPVPFDRTIKDFFKCEGSQTIGTIHDNPDMGAIPAYFSVRQDGKEIGVLSMATSKQQAFNNSPAGKYRGDSGFRIALFYIEGPTSVKANCTRNIEATDYNEIIKQIEITDEFDLSFEAGWNFVKVSIHGSQNVGNIPYYKTKKYSVISVDRLTDVNWVFYRL